jgi:formylglycine-generating enzyme required for sulfatase activity/serine/threonine protein kinase
MGSESDQLGLIGTSIADKYAVESVVGEGGFATVYRATHVLWKRPVAVKVFKALGEVAKEERKKLLDDFIQEGVLLADLSERSTAICQARDVGMLTTARGDQVPYMVLEWLEGKPLEGVLESERVAGAPLRSLEQTIRLLDPIAEALALAHKKGIAHRDMKPANVFVLGDPRGDEFSVKLLDFGIAKVVQDAQKMGFGKTAGHITSFTPAYGAPEQFNRAYGATGPWTDVFALALVAVEVLSGREPISGDNLVQLAYAASDPAVRPTPRTFGVAVSDDVDAVFRRALAVKPGERYQTAGEFWNALRMVAVGNPMSSLVSSRSFPATDSDPALSATVSKDIALAATGLALAPTGGPVPPNANAVTAASLAQPALATQSTKKKSSAPLIGAVIGAVAIAAAGAGVVALRKGSAAGVPSASVAASAPASAPATVSAAPVAAACPPGMKAIPGGMFFMGSDQKDAEANEKPPHKVKLAPYCLDELEVTVERYKACSDSGACLRAGKENVWPNISALQQKIYDPLCNIRDPIGKAKHPINCVDWEQARKFCEANDARLPTEAEWEFAARGSDGRIYPWGDDSPSAQLLNACGRECVAWMKRNVDPDQPIAAMYQEDDGFANTAPVGSFPKGKSSWGIQDIVGNVWEWVADWYAPYEPASETTVTADPKGPEKGTERVIRGGAWNGAMPAWVRPAWRFRTDPSFRTHGTGFRCAKTL